MVVYIIHTSIFTPPVFSTLTGKHQMLQQYWYLQQQRYSQTRTCSRQRKKERIQKRRVQRHGRVIHTAWNHPSLTNGYTGGLLPCVHVQPLQHRAEVTISKSFSPLLIYFMYLLQSVYKLNAKYTGTGNITLSGGYMTLARYLSVQEMRNINQNQ